MKLTLLILMMPFLAFSAPSTINPSLGLIKPESLKLGLQVTTVSSYLKNKTNKVSEEVTSYHLKVTTFNTGQAKMTDAFVMSEKGIMKSLSLVFNKVNGLKFRDDIIKQYGMPPADMSDNFQWKVEKVVFEIHETESGFTATYHNINPEPLIAQL